MENNFLAVPASVSPSVVVPNSSISETGGNETWDAEMVRISRTATVISGRYSIRKKSRTG